MDKYNVATPSTSRPAPPQPQDFGLSPERAKKLENPFKPGWMFWVPYAAVCFYVLISTRELLGNIAVIFLVAWPITLAVALAIPTSVAHLWARLQPDYPRYKQYKAASSRYQIELAAWVRTQRDWWLRLSGTSFEVEAGSVFSKRGYVVRRVGGSGDQGVDLLLTKDGVTIAVQCKAHRNPVGPAAIRDLYGAMTHHGHPEAWILSTAGFTRGAKAFAAGKPIKLLTVD